MTRTLVIAATQIDARLAASRVVAQAAFEDPEVAAQAGAALFRAGVAGIELSTTRVGVIRAARRIDGLLVGAGDVRTVAAAELAVRGGAHFATAPVTNMEVVHACRELGLPFFPGVATPGEIDRLVMLGLRTLRVFPVVPLGGPGFLQAVSASYPGVRFVPAGGIGPERLREYLRLPCVVAVAADGLIPQDLVRARSYDRIEWLAREALRARP